MQLINELDIVHIISYVIFKTNKWPVPPLNFIIIVSTHNKYDYDHECNLMDNHNHHLPLQLFLQISLIR